MGITAQNCLALIGNLQTVKTRECVTKGRLQRLDRYYFKIHYLKPNHYVF